MGRTLAMPGWHWYTVLHEYRDANGERQVRAMPRSVNARNAEHALNIAATLWGHTWAPTDRVLAMLEIE